MPPAQRSARQTSPSADPKFSTASTSNRSTAVHDRRQRSPPPAGVRAWILLKYHQYELLTALYVIPTFMQLTLNRYMLEPWEKAIFNGFVLAALFLSFYTAYMYLPDYLNYAAGELLEYFPMMKSIMPSQIVKHIHSFYHRQEL